MFVAPSVVVSAIAISTWPAVVPAAARIVNWPDPFAPAATVTALGLNVRLPGALGAVGISVMVPAIAATSNWIVSAAVACPPSTTAIIWENTASVGDAWPVRAKHQVSIENKCSTGVVCDRIVHCIVANSGRKTHKTAEALWQ